MSSNEMKFKDLVKISKNILAITGAGMSSESGIPTFRGAPALRWRNYQSENLANLPAFMKNPSLVWEFYHYRREICAKAHPNNAHMALANFEKNCEKQGKKFSIITQNVDGLHRRAGSQNIVAIHGELFETKCMQCNDVKENHDSPICEALRNRGGLEIIDNDLTDIPAGDLPRCVLCGGLLRPNVVWFGENLRRKDLSNSQTLIDNCDLCIVIGTSAVVQPVASFPLEIVTRGVPVAEFNTEETSITDEMSFFFQGPCAITVPPLLGD